MHDQEGKRQMTTVSTKDVRVPLHREELAKLKAKALRHGIWFKVLTMAERALIDVTVRVVEKVQSFLLTRLLTLLVKKLLDAMEGEVARTIRTMGNSLAERLAEVAIAWGNKSAIHWSKDKSFIRYLAITYINTPAMFR